MDNENIKEILEFDFQSQGERIEINEYERNILKDYITNLQEELHQASLDIQELTEKDIGCPSWCDKLTNLQEENEKLKEENIKLYKKDIKIINELKKELEITQEKWNKDKQFSKCRTMEMLDYKSRNENAQDLILNELSHLKANDEETWNKEFYDENNKLDYRKLCIELLNQVINLLDGGDEEC